MKTFFICANCLKETSLNIPCNATLICQKCGCGDIYFSNDVIVKPLAPGIKEYDSTPVPQGEPFLGRGPHGEIWLVSPPPEPEKPQLKSRRK